MRGRSVINSSALRNKQRAIAHGDLARKNREGVLLPVAARGAIILFGLPRVKMKESASGLRDKGSHYGDKGAVPGAVDGNCVAGDGV